jgi:hypothetical protein
LTHTTRLAYTLCKTPRRTSSLGFESSVPGRTSQPLIPNLTPYLDTSTPRLSTLHTGKLPNSPTPPSPTPSLMTKLGPYEFLLISTSSRVESQEHCFQHQQQHLLNTSDRKSSLASSSLYPWYEQQANDWSGQIARCLTQVPSRRQLLAARSGRKPRCNAVGI